MQNNPLPLEIKQFYYQILEQFPWLLRLEKPKKDKKDFKKTGRASFIKN